MCNGDPFELTKSKTVHANPLYEEEKENEFVNPLYMLNEQEEKEKEKVKDTLQTEKVLTVPVEIIQRQVVPAKVYNPDENNPVPDQKMGRKAKKKQEKQRREGYRREIAEINQRTQQEFPEEMYLVEQKDYLHLLTRLAKSHPSLAVYAERNDAFRQRHPEFDGVASQLTRDLAQLAGEANTSDEQMKMIMINLIKLEKNKADKKEGDTQEKKTNRADASAALLPVYTSTYNELYNKFDEMGLLSNKPVSCNEEYISKGYQTAHLYAQLQVMAKLGKAMDPPPPPEQVAFISACNAYVMGALTAAGNCMLTDAESKAALARHELENKKLVFRDMYNERLVKIKAGIPLAR